MTATGLRCGLCGTELPPDSRFCNKCGAPITQAATSAEYKQVTVLFADVVHSMDIAAAVGAERLREIMTELFDRSTAVVQRFGGTVDKFTGDGIMAVFGAPIALEDHALRACLAALGIQQATQRLATEVLDRDSVDLRLRVGLNSGQVIAGDIGSGAMGYTAIGEQVGMAQRMESVAPPGGVMLSESTARLVEQTTVLGDQEMLHIKGFHDPVPALRLISVATRRRNDGTESAFIGRKWEMSALAGILEQSINGKGCVVGVVGPPGIGKSRIAREVTTLATGRGLAAFTTYCESHTSEVPFHAITALLRAAMGVVDLDDEQARAHIREQLSAADAEDLILLDDLLGIADPEVGLPPIDPDARRRRLTSLVNAASLARATPAVYVIEDVHWIDEVSESMLADFLAVAPQTCSLVVITYRPEYDGALARAPRSQTIALEPLDDRHIAALMSELLGPDRSVADLVDVIAHRAAGNPFFAQEIVRDLVERGVLVGERGGYACRSEVGEVSVPRTLHAAIAARIDRLNPPAKRTLNAAAVIGSRFSPDLLEALQIEPVLDDVVRAELIDQIEFTPRAEYAFRHPLIRTVAYESQLKSDRTQLHRRLADAIEARGPESVNENAALIAEHREAAGDFRGAYAWHMRAGFWATSRDFAAAHLSWERARQIARALPPGDPDRTTMGIAALTQLCGNAWRIHADVSKDHFEELRTLCDAADDKISLAIGMGGLVSEHMIHGRVQEASRLASEQLALAESIGDPALAATLSFAAIAVSFGTGEAADPLRWSQAIIDLAKDDPERVSLFWKSPLAVALATRGVARWRLGHQEWRDDVDRARALGRGAEPMSHAIVMTYTYLAAIACGVLRADDVAVHDISEALQIAARSGNDIALGAVEEAMAVALLHRDSSADRRRGLDLLDDIRNMCLHNRYYASEIPGIEVYTARESARRGDLDGAIPPMRVAVDEMFRAEQFQWVLAAVPVLVETLLDRGADGDLVQAEAAVERLAAAPLEDGYVIRDVVLLRLRALLARARGDEANLRAIVGRYRDMARSHGFEGHMAWAEAMP